MLARLKTYAVLALLALLAAACGYLWFFGRPRGATRRLTDPPAIVREIQQLAELVTVRYAIEKVVGLQEDKVPFGNEQLLLLVRADVLAGVDLATLSEKNLTVAGPDRLIVHLPAARILHIVADDRETRVWDRQKTWWTPWVDYNPDLERKARLAAQESIRAAALEMGILREANRSAELAIRSFLKLAGYPQVEFEHAPAN